MSPNNKPPIRHIITIIVLIAAAPALSASDTLVAAREPIEQTLGPGIAAFYEAHDFARDGMQAEAIERGSEAIAFFESIIEETDDEDTKRIAHYYLAHTYLEVIVDAATWMRFNGDYEKTRLLLTRYENEDDYRFVEGKRYALYPPDAGGDASAALAMFDGIGDRYELAYHRAIAMLSLGDVDGAAEVLAAETNPTATESALLMRLEVERLQPRVMSVSFPSDIRTNGRLLERAATLEQGTPLSSDHAIDTISALESFPAVASADLEYDFDASTNEVDVRVRVREGDSRMFGVLAYGAYVPETDGLAPDSDDSSALPLLLYSDQNLFGRMVQLDVITAGVYWQVGLGVPGVFGSPLSIYTGVESMVLPMDTLEYGDFSVDGGGQAAWIGTAVDLGPLSTSLEYQTGFTVYDEDTIDTGVEEPRDLRHAVSAEISADMRSDLAGGAASEGFALTLLGAFTTFSGFEQWGTQTVLFDSPDGPGTFTYGIEADAGWRIGRRGDIGVAIGAYGGFGFFARTHYDVGAPGPGSDSVLSVRGYPTGTQAERLAVAHGRVGYELVPGTVHLGAFHDVAAVEAADWAPDPDGLLNASGVALSFALPWSIRMSVAYARSYTSLDDDYDGGRDVIELTMMRIATF